MFVSFGRAPRRAALACLASLVAAAPAQLRAQDVVIHDPELEGRREGGGGGSKGGDVIIRDPELEDRGAGGGGDNNGWGEVYQGSSGSAAPPPAAEEDTYDPQANTGIARIEVLGQFGSDLYHEGGLEDAYETRLRFDAEVEFRRSRKLRLSLGTRVDFFWALPFSGDPNLNIENLTDGTTRHYSAFEQDRFEADVIPTSAYVDTTPKPGLHLRLGAQPISMARMDFYSPTDILAVIDTRGQPSLVSSATRLAQPAVRLDWDLSSWATLQAVYVPWFMPNLTRPNRDANLARALGASGTVLPQSLQDLLSPSAQTQASDSALRLVGPAPDFKTPQAQGRITIRGTGMEFAISGGTALERLPAVYLTPTVSEFLRDPSRTDTDALLAAAAAGRPLLDVQYHRFYQIGFDGSFDLSPVQIGFEVGYSPERHMYTAPRNNRDGLPSPNTSVPLTEENVGNRSIRKGVPVASGAVHVEWMDADGYGLAAEAFWVQALLRPYDDGTGREWVGFVPGKAFMAGGLFVGSYSFGKGRCHVDLIASLLVGPSMIGAGQVECRVADGFHLNTGVQIYEGPAINQYQSINAGGALNNNDQAFIGFRYIP